MNWDQMFRVVHRTIPSLIKLAKKPFYQTSLTQCLKTTDRNTRSLFKIGKFCPLNSACKYSYQLLIICIQLYDSMFQAILQFHETN